jgi:prophage regulatory protein
MPKKSIEQQAPDAVLRLSQVVKLTGLSKSTIRRLELDGQFPRRRHISARAVGWKQSAVSAFIESRLADGRPQ